MRTLEQQPPRSGRRVYRRGSPEFERLGGISDSVFGIALTLLVFTLDASAVSLDDPAGVLRTQTGPLIAFLLSFAVIAGYWWVHHGFLARLSAIEPGLVLLNFVLLGAVALLPFPTSLLGRDPTTPGAVVPYLVVLCVVASTLVLLLLRAHAVGAWTLRLSPTGFRWLLAGWGASAAVTFLALGVAFVLPVAALAVLLLTWPAEAVVAHWAGRTGRAAPRMPAGGQAR